MAIKKSIDTSAGFCVEHHRISAFAVNRDDGGATVLVSSYKDAEARAAGKAAFPTDFPLQFALSREQVAAFGPEFDAALDVVLGSLYGAISREKAFDGGCSV